MRQPAVPTLIDALLENAALVGEQTAFTFLSEDAPPSKLGYASFVSEVKAAAAIVQTLTRPGDRVLLFASSDASFPVLFFGIIAAGCVAVPITPPSLRRPSALAGLVRNVLKVARPSVAVAGQPTLDALKSLAEFQDAFSSVRWLAPPRPGEGSAADWRRPPLEKNGLAFLQFTSGSTSAPKGVMVSNGNLVDNCRLIAKNLHIGSDSVFVSWLPQYHDMGLIGVTCTASYLARPVVLMPPLMFLKEPLSWLKAISEYRGTTCKGPNFAYQLCVDRVPDEALPSLDLSSWTCAINGSEPVRASTVRAFIEKFSRAGFPETAFYPAYGLAESTLYVTTAGGDRKPRVLRLSCEELGRGQAAPWTGEGAFVELVSCGPPVDYETRIIDPETLERLPEGRVGEVIVSGASVTQGYWEAPQETADTYVQLDGKRFLRTGDLGFLADGELYLASRMKDLIIVRGRNVFPSDIEAAAELAHPAFRRGCVACFGRETQNEEKVVVAIEVERRVFPPPPGARVDEGAISRMQTRMEPSPTPAPAPPIFEEMAIALRSHVLKQLQLRVDELYFLQAGEVPKTTSGKVQRRAARRLLEEGKLAVLFHSVDSHQ